MQNCNDITVTFVEATRKTRAKRVKGRYVDVEIDSEEENPESQALQ